MPVYLSTASWWYKNLVVTKIAGTKKIQYNKLLVHLCLKTPYNIFFLQIEEHSDRSTMPKHSGRSTFYSRNSLCDMAASGKTKNIEEVFESNPKDLYTKQKGTNSTALLVACENGHMKACAKLISLGAEVNEKDREGKSALAFAAERGMIQMGRVLIDSGSEVRTDGKAMEMAIKEGKEAFVDLLLENKADVNILCGISSPLLVTAALGWNVKILLTLLESKASLEGRDENGNTALILASENNNERHVKHLIRLGAAIEATNKKNNTALLEAIYKSNEPVVERLLNAKADIEHQNGTNDNPLRIATHRESFRIVQSLGEMGANIEAFDSGGFAPLALAALSGNTLIFNYLIKQGGDVNTETKDNATPLTLACQNGHKAIAKLCIDLGAKFDHADKWGNTPLIISVRQCHIAIVDLLLSHQCSADAINNNGFTALSMSAKNGDTGAVKALLKHRPEIRFFGHESDNADAIMQAAVAGETEILEALIHHSEAKTEYLICLIETEGKSMPAASRLLINAKIQHRAMMEKQDKNKLRNLKKRERRRQNQQNHTNGDLVMRSASPLIKNSDELRDKPSLDANAKKVQVSMKFSLNTKDGLNKKREQAKHVKKKTRNTFGKQAGHSVKTNSYAETRLVQGTKDPATDAPAAKVTKDPATDTPAAKVTKDPATDTPAAKVTKDPATDAPAAKVIKDPATDAPAAKVTKEITPDLVMRNVWQLSNVGYPERITPTLYLQSGVLKSVHRYNSIQPVVKTAARSGSHQKCCMTKYNSNQFGGAAHAMHDDTINACTERLVLDMLTQLLLWE
jgi:ankyrin repeat protein